MNLWAFFVLFFFAQANFATNEAKPVKTTTIPRAPTKPKTTQAKKKEELDKLVDAIQKHYNSTKSASFSFEQNYKHPFMAMNESSKGKVYFKAKNMLWRYTEPADRQKEFYIAGKKFTYYLIPDALAYTHDCFDQDTLSASITFLWGKGKLRESFTITPYAQTPPNPALSWLTLVPKEKNAPVKSISLGAESKTGVVKESIVVDQSDGINHFKFYNFELNKAIPDKIFVFVPPSKVRVQPMPNVQCPSSTPVPTPAPKKVLPAKKS